MNNKTSVLQQLKRKHKVQSKDERTNINTSSSLFLVYTPFPSSTFPPQQLRPTHTTALPPTTSCTFIPCTYTDKECQPFDKHPHIQPHRKPNTPTTFLPNTLHNPKVQSKDERLVQYTTSKKIQNSRWMCKFRTKCSKQKKFLISGKHPYIEAGRYHLPNHWQRFFLTCEQQHECPHHWLLIYIFLRRSL